MMFGSLIGLFKNDTSSWNDTDGGTGDGDDEKISGLNFVDSFVKALSVMIVSELGDKTFFLAGLPNLT